MKKKSLTSMLIALGLVGTIMIGATMAYLTDKTEEVVNTFTIGRVEINLTEPGWNPEDAENLEPGAEITKDPVVTNNGKNDAYIAVKVTGMEAMRAVGFEAGRKDAQGSFTAGVNEGWVLVDENGNVEENWDGSLVDGIYAYHAVLTKDEATTPLFDTVIFTDNGTYNKTYTIHEVANDPAEDAAGTHFEVEGADGRIFATYEEARAYVDSVYEEMTTSFDLVLTAYAIQTTGFELTTEGAYTWVAEFTY